MEESYDSVLVSNGDILGLPKGSNDASLTDSLVGMSKEEMTQHLKLCMKLAAENKINGKNAFGLHLIGIMRHLMKSETPDLQFASMSLQASTKIYAGRVEALYKDTYQFHSHLQNIVAQGKKAAPEVRENDLDCNDQSDDDEGGGNKAKPQRNKSKSFLSSEENINIQSITENSVLLKPHGNFVLIKSAFCASRTAPKLVHSLPVELDKYTVHCGTASICFKRRQLLHEETSSFPHKLTGYFEKLKDLHISPRLSTITSCSDVFLNSNRTPKSPNNADAYFDMGSFTCGDDPHTPFNNIPNPTMNSIIERFSVLDITANDFASDIAQAITGENTINRLLLPPKSALKKVLRERETSLGTSPPKTTKKEKKPKGPFFCQDHTIDRSLFTAGGRKNDLSDVAISEWSLSEITDLCTNHDIFSNVLGHYYGQDKEKAKLKELDAFKCVTTMTQDMENSFILKNFFHKRPQAWKKIQPKSYDTLLRPSSIGIHLQNEERTQSLFAGDTDNIVQSLQSMSLHNSFDCDDGLDGVEQLSPLQGPEPDFLPHNGSFLDEDIYSMMVPPPELVKPINVRFSKKPMNVNTEKFKESLWKILSEKIQQTSSTLLSVVYKELQEVFNNDPSSGISLQMTFVMLLILSNEKVLLLQNIDDSDDLRISKDEPEISSTEIF